MTKVPGIMIAGISSNSGKTTTALGLVSALGSRGLGTLAGKCGPDYIDAAWLAKAANRPCVNIDLWMSRTDPAKILAKFAHKGDFLVLEAAMGLFDGPQLGTGSAADIAAMLDLPILLLVPCKGMGQSVAALAKGFLTYQPDDLHQKLKFCGVIATHIGSERHWEIIAGPLAEVCREAGIPLLGYLPRQNCPQIPSRHLGLVQAGEENPDFALIGSWFESHVDLEKLLKQAGKIVLPEYQKQHRAGGPVIAIARDAAFSFCYADLPHMLGEMGAEIVYFSPLSEHDIPHCDGIYFPGGYPELFAEKLAVNSQMLAKLRSLAQEGLPIYGECGGYMYLMEGIADGEGKIWPMAGLMPGVCHMGQKVLGYREAIGDCRVFGHEFHYCVAQGENQALPMWHTKDSAGKDRGSNGQSSGNVQGSWIHLYPEGSREFWQKWLKKAEDWKYETRQRSNACRN